MQESDVAEESTFLKMNFVCVETGGCDRPLEASSEVSLPGNAAVCII